ncbi:MAG: ABC transporter ATP-binding protein [Kofleriaceae bacterium]|nr:ABC transporter ATP-binding protein [Myxococcales bacterium]MCB9564166.1 ABC transporter ATP-binding protein [Kofleriaceae bacterium]
MTTPLLSLRAISKVYGVGEAEVHALRAIDLDVAEGEFVALMGPSGSGKSTCLNILGCLDVATSGEYRFRGQAVSGLDRDQRALLRRHYLGFVFQGFNLLARTSALENVELPLVYLGVGRRERRRRSLAALAAVGLEGRERHTPSQLSGGQQQRVAIARALVTEPSLILADEPTGNVDSARAHEIMGVLAGLNRDRGITIVMVTHEPDMAAYAHRVVRFLDGRIAADERQVPWRPEDHLDDGADDHAAHGAVVAAGVGGAVAATPEVAP